jgi:MEMO1 family protein
MKKGVVSLILLFLLIPGLTCCVHHNKNTRKGEKSLPIMQSDSIINRKPAVAGTFYPGSHDVLYHELDSLFSKATPAQNQGNIIAVISPHAGYVYSGIVAASAFNQLSRDKIYENIFVIGSSHRASYDAASVYCDGNFITPLGIVKVNMALAKELVAQNPEVLLSLPDAHAEEHSLEVQLPFLQYIYKDKLQIVPILLGTQRPTTIRKIADALKPYLNGKNLFVISTDFSHYPVYEDAYKVDKATADAILKNSSRVFMSTLDNNQSKGITNLATSICGWTSMLTFLYMTETNQDIHYHHVRYMNSGDMPLGDKDRVVGYNAITVTLDKDSKVEQTSNEYSLSNLEKSQLLKIARVTIKGYLETNEIPILKTEGFSAKLLAPSGAFVTLTRNGNLRGCIGRFSADMPLYRTVQEMAVAAAVNDYRFSKLTLDELNEVDIEISVLTPMRKIKSINEIVLGKDGIYIKKGNAGGTFLPQVATQTGWNLEEFLGHCAQDKAGIGWNGWKDADIFVYEAYVFGEK